MFTAGMRVAALSVFLLLVPAGCGSDVTMSNYERIRAGMTLAEVEAILGPGEEQVSSRIDVPGQSFSVPGGSSVSVDGVSLSSKVVSWTDGARVISVTLSDGKVVSKGQLNL